MRYNTIPLYIPYIDSEDHRWNRCIGETQPYVESEAQYMIKPYVEGEDRHFIKVYAKVKIDMWQNPMWEFCAERKKDEGKKNILRCLSELLSQFTIKFG